MLAQCGERADSLRSQPVGGTESVHFVKLPTKARRVVAQGPQSGTAWGERRDALREAWRQPLLALPLRHCKEPGPRNSEFGEGSIPILSRLSLSERALVRGSQGPS